MDILSGPPPCQWTLYCVSLFRIRLSTTFLMKNSCSPLMNAGSPLDLDVNPTKMRHLGFSLQHNGTVMHHHPKPVLACIVHS